MYARRPGICSTHGEVEFVQRGDTGTWRCVPCRAEAVTARRKRVKAILVAEAGGRCVACGYDRCMAALQFHHLRPEEKQFSLGRQGVARSLEKARGGEQMRSAVRQSPRRGRGRCPEIALS
jgi:hypothetical protein